MTRFVGKTRMARIDADLIAQLEKQAKTDGTSITDASRLLARRLKEKPQFLRRDWSII